MCDAGGLGCEHGARGISNMEFFSPRAAKSLCCAKNAARMGAPANTYSPPRKTKAPGFASGGW